MLDKFIMKLMRKHTQSVILFVVLMLAGAYGVEGQEVFKVDSVVGSNEVGVEDMLSGNAVGIKIKKWTGSPGFQSIINLRGLNLLDESSAPLIMVNEVPVISAPSGVTSINPLSYYPIEQIEKIEIIKDISQLSKYGVLAPNGAINIITKSGVEGPLHVDVNAFLGYNFLTDYDYKKDNFYNFNTIARKKIFSSSMTHKEGFTINGGGAYGSYFFGVNNHTDKGILEGTSFSRQSIFLNAEYNITDKFKTKFYNNLSLAKRDGRYAADFDRFLSIPRVNSEKFFMDENKNIGLLSSVDLGYELRDNLHISSLVGISYETSRNDLYVPSNLQNGDIFSQSVAYKRQLLSFNSKLDYSTKLGNEIAASFTIGNEIVLRESRITNVSGRRNIEAGGSDYVKVVKGYSAGQIDAMSNFLQDRLLSFYGYGQFDYDEQLQVDLVLRADGSSLYKDKWALYPSLGIVYNLSEQPLSLNFSIGKVGLLSDSEKYRGQLTEFGKYYNNTELGIGHLYEAYDDAKSASVFQYDAGVKYTFKGVSLSLQYFNKAYKDFTYLRYLANTKGVDFKVENGMEANLQGVEFSLKGDVLKNDVLTWNLNANIAYHKNKITELPSGVERTSLSRYASLGNGDVLTSIIAYENGILTTIGDREPEVFGGISNILSVGNIEGGFKFTFVTGADVVNQSFNSRYLVDYVGAYPVKAAETPFYFLEKDGKKRAVYQGISSVQNASFLSLSSAFIAYDFEKLSENSNLISGMQLYVRGENLLMLSDYSGVSPQENTDGIRRHDLSTTGTPIPASVVLGLKVKF